MTPALPAALHFAGANDHTPVRAFATALTKIVQRPGVTSRNYADLTIYPVLQDDATGERWYELWWTHRVADIDPGPHADGYQGDRTETGAAPIELIAVLPAPPVIPAQQRLAAAPPVDTSHLAAGEIRMLGGEDEARTFLEARQRTAIRTDRTTDIFDWDAYALSLLDQLTTLEPRKLTLGQRAAVSIVRLLDAEAEVAAARSSVLATTQNAERAGESVDRDLVRLVLHLPDPVLAP